MPPVLQGLSREKGEGGGEGGALAQPTSPCVRRAAEARPGRPYVRGRGSSHRLCSAVTTWILSKCALSQWGVWDGEETCPSLGFSSASPAAPAVAGQAGRPTACVLQGLPLAGGAGGVAGVASPCVGPCYSASGSPWGAGPHPGFMTILHQCVVLRPDPV